MNQEPQMEIIKFNGTDEECTQLIQENCTTVVSSQGLHNKGSSKLTLKNFVNFNWDQCYYRGQLIALHASEKFIAYGFTKPGTSEGLVRVVKRETNERTLIKGFSSLVEDLRFAHLYELIMLACIDQEGNVYVYVVNEDTSKKLRVYPIFQVFEDPSYNYKNRHLISWCQFMPEQVNSLREQEFSSTYCGKILAVIRSSEVEIWHIGIASNFISGPVCSNLSLNKTYDVTMLNNISKALIKIDLKDADIVYVSFSPNGSNIALALSNGSVFFYEICFNNNEVNIPQCVYTWNPKEIFLSLKSMAFLDNRREINGDVELWKYVVTFSTNNELMLWSCETWKCLQKLLFVRPSITNNPMKLSVDETGKYIFLSDIDNNQLYIMEVSLDINSPKKHIKIVSITEVLLQSPMLNMIIVNAKIDHNDINSLEQYDSSIITSESLNKYTTIINLFAIQPKSIQEGQLIISSPELSIMEQFGEQNKIEPKNLFPKPPSLKSHNNTADIAKNNIPELETRKEKSHSLIDISAMEMHNLVKEKLRLKGINLYQKNTPSNSKKLLKHNNNLGNKQQTQLQPPYTFPQNTYDMNEVRECSPSNNEVQNILHEQGLQFDYRPIEPIENVQNDSYESASSYSIDVEKEESANLSFSNISLFNGSSISTIRQPVDRNEVLDNDVGNHIDNIYSNLQDINYQLKFLIQNQKKTDQTTSCLSINSIASDICNKIEPVLLNMMQTSSDQSHIKLQKLMDHQLGASQKIVADIVKNSHNIDTDLFTKTLVTSLSPTLDTILKDLFMSTVIPKFEHACCSMFKQIDESFTERSLEYQNELKLLLNEEGNINSKLDYAFNKFKSDMSGIIKHTEKNILNVQNDMQKHFSNILKEKSLSHVESYVNDTEIMANRLLVLNNFIDRGEYVAAFEKALSASNLDLVLHVCEKISPEDLFQPLFKTPILLSLIQQLSQDLIYNTELKHKYLDAAVSSLDYTTSLHENIVFVLQIMEKNVEKFVQQCPLHPCTRKFKMLQYAVKTIISSYAH